MAIDLGRRVLRSLSIEGWIHLWATLARLVVSLLNQTPKRRSLLRLRLDTARIRVDLQLPPETDPTLLRLALQGMTAMLNRERADGQCQPDAMARGARCSRHRAQRPGRAY